MKSTTSGLFQLMFACTIIIAIWMFVLPVVSEFPSVRHRINGNRAAGINPTAVFYTDHPGMSDIERSIASRVNSPTGSFWKFSFSRSPELSK